MTVVDSGTVQLHGLFAGPSPPITPDAAGPAAFLPMYGLNIAEATHTTSSLILDNGVQAPFAVVLPAERPAELHGRVEATELRPPTCCRKTPRRCMRAVP